MKHLASTNLITDLKFKQKVGVKADSFEETLAIINNDESSLAEVKIDAIDAEARNDLQINAKLFIASFDSGKAFEAVTCLKQVLGINKIDSLTVSVPAEAIDLIGIGAQNADDTEGEVDIPSTPERSEAAKKMKQLWATLAEKLTTEVNSIGLCDLETDIFFELFNESQVKPNFVQVNLKSCCVVPPKLQAFAKDNQIKLSTHPDPPSILSQEFMSQIQKKPALKPDWIIRYQLFIKARGVLQDKRYLIHDNI